MPKVYYKVRICNDTAWWGMVLREPRLTAVGNGQLLYLGKATMVVDSDLEHYGEPVGIQTRHLRRSRSSATKPFIERGLVRTCIGIGNLISYDIIRGRRSG